MLTAKAKTTQVTYFDNYSSGLLDHHKTRNTQEIICVWPTITADRGELYGN